MPLPGMAFSFSQYSTKVAVNLPGKRLPCFWAKSTLSWAKESFLYMRTCSHLYLNECFFHWARSNTPLNFSNASTDSKAINVRKHLGQQPQFVADTCSSDEFTHTLRCFCAKGKFAMLAVFSVRVCCAPSQRMSNPFGDSNGMIIGSEISAMLP